MWPRKNSMIFWTVKKWRVSYAVVTSFSSTVEGEIHKMVLKPCVDPVFRDKDSRYFLKSLVILEIIFLKERERAWSPPPQSYIRCRQYFSILKMTVEWGWSALGTIHCRFLRVKLNSLEAYELQMLARLKNCWMIIPSPRCVLFTEMIPLTSGMDGKERRMRILRISLGMFLDDMESSLWSRNFCQKKKNEAMSDPCLFPSYWIVVFGERT